MAIYWVLLAMSSLAVPVISGQSCTVEIKSDADFVLFGNETSLKCSSNCTYVNWETRLTKKSTSATTVINSTSSSSVVVLVNDWTDHPITCLADDGADEEFKAVVRVIPYALPPSVDIGLMGELEENKEHEVKCSVNGVAPVKYVMLSVTRGGELFLSKTYENDNRTEPQNLMETFKFIANRSDNMEEFACQVTLNLTRVSNTTVLSSSVTVRTFALPEDPRITAERWVEKGTVTDISCAVPQAFPSDNVITQLYVEGYPNATGDVLVSSSVNTSDLRPAQHKVVCVSEVYSSSRQSEVTIHIYEPPKLNLTLSRQIVNLNDAVTVDCNLTDGTAEYFGLYISVDGAEVNRTGTPHIAEDIVITERKANVFVTCSTFILENKKVLLTSEDLLAVHYPPEFSNSSCPDSRVWVEGRESMFSCRSDGNPTPEEQCTFNQLKSSASFTAERNMSGVYTCRASNSEGTVTRSVEVTVQYPPGHPTVNISTSSINAGGSVTLSCHSDALPPPEYRWEVPTQDQVDISPDKRSISIREASSQHSGKYTCYVYNKHGEVSADQELQVISDKTTVWIIIAVVGVILLVAAIIGLAYYLLNQNGKKGFYDLLKGRSGKSSAEIPLKEKNTEV